MRRTLVGFPNPQQIVIFLAAGDKMKRSPRGEIAVEPGETVSGRIRYNDDRGGFPRFTMEWKRAQN